MTARRLLTTYRPLIAVLHDGYHITQFLEVCSKPEPVSMSELRSAIDRTSRENWLKASLITIEKRGLCRYVHATSKALKFLRCKTHAEACTLWTHKRLLHPKLALKLKTFATLLAVAVHGPKISINDARLAAGLTFDGADSKMVHSCQREGWITLEQAPDRATKKWLLTITPLGLEALGVTD